MGHLLQNSSLFVRMVQLLRRPVASSARSMQLQSSVHSKSVLTKGLSSTNSFEALS